jgi:hypothetical protein
VRDKINGTSCAINLARLGFFFNPKERKKTKGESMKYQVG